MIPASGPFTSEDIGTEWNLGAAFTSEQVAAAVGLTIPWSTDDLRGKSSVLAVSLSTTTVSGEVQPTTPANTTITSSQVTATVTGGTLPRTLLWEKVSGTTMTVTSQGQAATTFSLTVSAYGTFTAVYRLKATDNGGTIAYGPNVTVTQISTNPNV